MLKRTTAVLISLFSVLLLSSCNFDITELSDRLIIEAIGIDKTENGWKITVQTLDTKQSGTSGMSESKENITLNYTSEGATISQAMDKLMVEVGQETLYSQTRVLVIGRQAAAEDVSKLIDYFLREYTTRDDTLVALADDKAEDIISSKLGESTIGARIIENEIEVGFTNGLCVKVPMYYFVNLLTSETDSAYIPVIKTEKTEDDTDKLSICGTAVFTDFKLKLILDNETTTGLMLLNDMVTNCVLSFELRDGVKTAVEIIKSDTDIRVLSTGDALTADIGCRFSCDIIEYSSERLEELSAEVIKEIENAASERAGELMQNAYDKAIGENGCDIARLGRRLWRKYPELYAGYLQNKDNALKGIEEKISIKVKVRLAGKETVEY